jgi:hypothetical protein
MKEVNFRIIELPTHQVLLTKDFDDDEESIPLLTITFFLEGVKVDQKLGYYDEAKRDEMFDKVTAEQVQKTLDNALSMFND